MEHSDIFVFISWVYLSKTKIVHSEKHRIQNKLVARIQGIYIDIIDLKIAKDKNNTSVNQTNSRTLSEFACVCVRSCFVTYFQRFKRAQIICLCCWPKWKRSIIFCNNSENEILLHFNRLYRIFGLLTLESASTKLLSISFSRKHPIHFGIGSVYGEFDVGWIIQSLLWIGIEFRAKTHTQH